MKNYSFKLNKLQIQKIKDIYKPFLIETKNKYVNFSLCKDDVKMTAYSNGTFFITGKFIEKQILDIKKISEIADFSAIGSDESGTGDVFGSIVVCAAYVDKKNISFLENLNIKDSKKITDKKVMSLIPQIVSRIPYSLVSLSPFKYNKLITKGFNLNKIKALLHNHMILKTLDKVKKNVSVILDQFTLSKNYFHYLKDEKIVYDKINFQTNAESFHISVAVSSIIARYAFLKSINDLNNEVGLKLKLGSSKVVDKQISSIVKKKGINFLKNIAKFNFKNITKQFNF